MSVTDTFLDSLSNQSTSLSTHSVSHIHRPAIS